jgi:hypothetical protein
MKDWRCQQACLVEFFHRWMEGFDLAGSTSSTRKAAGRAATALLRPRRDRVGHGEALATRG